MSTRVDAWLQWAEEELQANDIGTSRLDALVLLEDALGLERSRLLAHPEMEIPVSVINVLNKQVARRATHEPLAYVRGKSEFYSREFVVSPAVLEPRPESEAMIDLLKVYLHGHPKLDLGSSKKRHPEGIHNQLDSSLRWNDTPGEPIHIADVGTGSGALGITAALEVKNTIVDLLEIDHKAIEIAKMNVIKFATSQKVIKSDLLSHSSQNYDILLCNLPYVPDGFQINQAAMREPKIAIFGGPDGLDVYRKLFAQIEKSKTKPLLILTESLPPQHEAFKDIAAAAGYALEQTEDFIQAFKRTV